MFSTPTSKFWRSSALSSAAFCAFCTNSVTTSISVDYRFNLYSNCLVACFCASPTCSTLQDESHSAAWSIAPNQLHFATLFLVFPHLCVEHLHDSVLLCLDISAHSLNRCAHLNFNYRGNAHHSCFYFLFQLLGHRLNNARCMRLRMLRHLLYMSR